MNDNDATKKKFPVKHTDEYAQACKRNGDDERGCTVTPAYVDPWDGLVYIEGQVAPRKSMPTCPTCKGIGSFRGDRVPYGSTTARLPDEMCETCYGLGIELPEDVLEMIAEDRATKDAKALEELSEIASVAHEGGLRNMTESDAMNAIRKLSLPYWTKT